MSDPSTYDQVESYLADAMSADERRIFEQQMDADPALRAEVLLHQEVTETLRGEKVHELRKVLKEVDQNFQITDTANPTYNQVRTLPFRRLLAIAAAVAAMVVTVFVLMPDAAMSNDDLFAQHYEPYKMILNQRSADDAESTEQLVKAAVMAYETKDYKQAAVLFETLLAQQPHSETFQLYHAITLISSDDAGSAIEPLNKLLSNASPLFVEQSRWYLAMAYLKSGNTNGAKSTLQAIEKGAFQFAAAQQILKEFP